MATIPRSYLTTYKANLNTIQPKNGQVISLWDEDGLYYDAPDDGTPNGNPVRRKASGVKVITSLPADPVEDILYVYIGDHGYLPDGTTKLYDLRVWVGTGWYIVGTNQGDSNVETEVSNDKFYLVGSPDSTTSIGTLLKYVASDGIYVQYGKINGTITQADNADTATDATNAVKATKDNLNQAITSYVRGISGTDNANGTLLTVTKGDGVTSTIQTKDTTYPVFDSTHAGIVNSTNTTVGSDTSGKILCGDGWISTSNITMPLADKANKDSAGQTITSTYYKNASISGTTLTLTKGDGTTTTDIAIPDTTYSIFTTTTDGLAPKANGSGDTAKFLRGDASWQTAITPSDVYAGSTAGIVPSAGSGNTGKYLRNDGTWAGTFSTGTMGLVPGPTNADTGKFLKGDGTWAADNDTQNTAGSNQDTAKLYLVGAKSQTTGTAGAQTFSNSAVYEQSGKLYSNSAEVVDVSSSQAITNKTYEGYTLGNASEATIGTSLNSTTTALDTFTGDGTTTTFGPLSDTAIDILSVLVNGTEVAYTTYSLQSNSVVFTTAPAASASISVTYSVANPSYGSNYLPTSSAVIDYVDDQILDVAGAITHKVDDSVLNAEMFSADASTTYAAGDFCFYNDGNGVKLYRATGATAGETFVSNYWAKQAVGYWRELTGILTAGSTSVTISDNSITTNSFIQVFTDTDGVAPLTRTVTAGNLTLTFVAQAADVNIRVRVS